MSNLPVNLPEIESLAKHASSSGYFNDAKQLSQAVMKMTIAQSLGLPAIAGLTGVSIIEGKPVLGATLVASLVEEHPRFLYKVLEHTNDICSIEFFERGKDGQPVRSLGTSTFTMDDAKKAGLAGKQNWAKYPRNMLFARAMTNGARWYAPSAFNGLPVYNEDELDDVILTSATTVTTEAPAPAVKNGDALDAEFRSASSPPAQPEVIDAQFTPDEPPAPVEPSPEQRAMFFAIHGEIGMPAHDGIDKQVNYRVWGKIVGREVTSWTQLSKAEVSQIVDWMNAVKEGRAKIPPIHKYRDELTGQATLQPQEPRGMIDGFSDLVKRLKLTEGQVDKLLKLKGDRNADTIACCGWIRGYETFEQFETLFADAFDDLEEMNGGAA